MKGLRDKEELTAEIAEDGAIHVENHLCRTPARASASRPRRRAEGIHGKAARSAAAQVLSRELGMRARRVAAAKADAFKLTRAGRVLWRDEEIASSRGRRRSAEAAGDAAGRRAPVADRTARRCRPASKPGVTRSSPTA